MSMKRLAIIALLAACTIVPAAMAQMEGSQKNEISVLIGRTFISNQGITSGALSGSTLRFGNGTSFEGNYARRMMDARLFSVSAEVPFVLNPDEDYHTPANPVGNYRSYMVTPAARVNLVPDLGISPWLSVGGGFGHFGSGSITSANTTVVLQAGLGLDVKILKSFSVRGEARDFWSGVPHLNVNTGKSRQHNILVAAGIVCYF